MTQTSSDFSGQQEQSPIELIKPWDRNTTIFVMLLLPVFAIWMAVLIVRSFSNPYQNMPLNIIWAILGAYALLYAIFIFSRIPLYASLDLKTGLLATRGFRGRNAVYIQHVVECKRLVVMVRMLVPGYGVKFKDKDGGTAILPLDIMTPFVREKLTAVIGEKFTKALTENR